MSDGLWSFYLKTVVDVWLEDGRVLAIGQRPEGVDEWPFGDASVAWIITACNPRSEPLSEEENSERHRQMGETLAEAGHAYLETVGFDPDDRSWSEIGYAVLDADEAEVMALAEAWDQNAVYRWTPEAWETIGVLLPGHSRSGWQVLGAPARSD
jgi:hypothetical protein